VLTSKSIRADNQSGAFSGQAVTIFEDEVEKISLKLTELGSEGEKP
jgi:hypothetical protein